MPRRAQSSGSAQAQVAVAVHIGLADIKERLVSFWRAETLAPVLCANAAQQSRDQLFEATILVAQIWESGH